MVRVVIYFSDDLKCDQAVLSERLGDLWYIIDEIVASDYATPMDFEAAIFDRLLDDNGIMHDECVIYQRLEDGRLIVSPMSLI